MNNEPRVIKRTNFFAKGADLTMTFAKWAAAGFPGRHPDDVADLFNGYCLGRDVPSEAEGGYDGPCDFYDPDERAIPLIGPKGLCRGCGCHVSDDATEWTNAIVIPVKPCPKGFFGGEVNQPLDSESSK